MKFSLPERETEMGQKDQREIQNVKFRLKKKKVVDSAKEMMLKDKKSSRGKRRELGSERKEKARRQPQSTFTEINNSS